jgi:hypothetical protein
MDFRSALILLIVVCVFIGVIWGAAAGGLWLIAKFELPRPVKWFYGGLLLLIVIFAVLAIIDYHYPALLHSH